MSTNYNNKIKGSIFGGLIADSIGFLFEGHSQSFIKKYLTRIKNKEIINYVRGYSEKININGPINNKNRLFCKWSYDFGQYTDDSQLSLLIIDNILKNSGKFSIEDYGYQITELFVNEKIVGYGNTTKTFTKNIIGGIKYKYAGHISTSNGSLMRSDIFGILFFNKSNETLIDCIYKQSMMTHLSNLSFVTSLCSAYVIKYIMNNKEIRSDILLSELYSLVKNINIKISKAITEMNNIINLEWKDAFIEIKKYETIVWDKNKLSSCCLTTFLWALYSFLNNKNSFEDCLIMALQVGGDVDTIGKIACSYSGCYLGINNLPKIFLEKIHDNNERNYQIIDSQINKLIEYIKNDKIYYL